MARRTTLVVAGVTGVMLLVALASTAGAPLLRTPQGEVGDPEPGDAVEPPPAPPTIETPPPDAADGGSSIAIDERLLLAVLGLVALTVLVLYIRSRLGQDREATPELLDTLDLLEEATDEQARGRILAMGGDPRNAIVAAWVEVERAVSAGGVERAPSETSTDLVRRVVSDLGVDPTPLVDLGGRYRAARFSEHPVAPAQVQEAVALLSAVHTDLAARSRRRDDAAAAGPPEPGTPRTGAP